MIQVQTPYLINTAFIRSLKIIHNGFSCNIDNLTSVVKTLKDYYFYITTGTVIDKPNKRNRFLLYYIFSCYIQQVNIYVSTKSILNMVSVSDLFSSTIWIERECFDLFGVFFENNNFPNGIYDLRRILTDYQFKGHPLRKDFSCVGYHSKSYDYCTKTIVSKSKLFL